MNNRILRMIDWLSKCIPHVQHGETSWCGKFWILHAPRNLSRFMGRGDAGLWLYRWTERGSAIIAAEKADRKARGLL